MTFFLHQRTSPAFQSGRMLTTLLAFFVLFAMVGGSVYAWLHQPLNIPADGIDINVPQGASVTKLALDLERKGVIPNARLLGWVARGQGKARDLQAGEYHLSGPQTYLTILDEFMDGHRKASKFTLVEGVSVREMLEAFEKHPEIKQTYTRDSLAQLLGLSVKELEGAFYPDTYFFDPKAGVKSVLKQAQARMQSEVDKAWEKRAPDSPLKSPREAQILASVIEKETGSPADRGLVGSVFVNRLKIGMRLQSDPTVIYGIGDDFDGNIRKKDLLTDTPYNSYTRAGLPPTPIAAPGRPSLMAAVNPPASEFIYFVSRGDGTSEFSATLAAHNRAVAKYQLGK